MKDDLASIDASSIRADASEANSCSADEIERRGMDWLAQYGDSLYSYAIQRVNNHEVAEELVQETFLGAMSALGRFAGQASEKTWLIGILRHKLVDYYRAKARRSSLNACIQEQRASNDEADLDWIPARTGPWRDPTAAMHEAEFQAVLRGCIGDLPDLVRQALELRFFDEMEPEEICELQGISSNNLATRLYRARLYLRDCLAKRWQ